MSAGSVCSVFVRVFLCVCVCVCSCACVRECECVCAHERGIAYLKIV